MNYSKKFQFFILSFLIITFLSGCSLVIQKGRRSDLERIQALEEELSELRSAKSLLENKLSQEIKDKQVRLEMQEKGLVITVLAGVLFDSGKAKLRRESFSILDKVAGVLKSKLSENNIGIEGHTDNQPIKFSGWKSNWELSAYRALSVLHYLESKGITAGRLSAIGYGEFRPVASNDTKEGQQLNRRVEIVVLPRLVKQLESEIEASEEILK